MNLYFRLFWLLLWRVRRANDIGFLGTSRIRYRALPSDCDINLHLTNSRYPAFMDLARTYMMAEMGLLKRFLKLKWMPIVNAAEFTYVRDIRPLQQFEIASRVVGWDEKYFYIEQRFLSDRGLHAIVHVRGLFVCKRKPVPTENLLTEAGFNETTPELPAEIIKWKSFLDLKKAHNS